jgi:hypothetical protein
MMCTNGAGLLLSVCYSLSYSDLAGSGAPTVIRHRAVGCWVLAALGSGGDHGHGQLIIHFKHRTEINQEREGTVVCDATNAPYAVIVI